MILPNLRKIEKRRIGVAFYCLLILFLTYLTYGKGLLFSFWKDDWYFLWSALYEPKVLGSIWLHPGTTSEFFVLSRIFGTNVILWQHFGVVLRAMSSLAVAAMVQVIANSSVSGYLAGIFFASSLAGFEAVHWPSAHVVNLLVLFLCMGLRSWTLYLRSFSKTDLFLSLLFIIVGVFTDPWRALPIFLFMFIQTRLIRPLSRQSIAGVRILLFLLVLAIGGAYVSYGTTLSDGPLLYKLLVSGNGITFFVNKLYVVNYYCNSLFNMILGWVLPAPHYINEMSHSYFIRSRAVSGWLIVLFWLCVSYIQVRKHVLRKFIIYHFFVVWVLLFYLFHWLFEPRLIVAEPHRYLVVPSVGIAGFIAYFSARLRYRKLAYFLAVMFVTVNIVTVRKQLKNITEYRSKGVVESVWTTMDHAVSYDAEPKVFIYMGEEPIKTSVLDIPGAAPFALIRKLKEYKEIPIVTTNTDEIVRYLCDEKPKRELPAMTYDIADRIGLHNVYAFSIQNNGVLKDVSVVHRQRLIELARREKCNPEK